MKETITIENFGGIKYIDFEFKSINILIGPQASGKSIVVKLTYFFKTFFSEIVKGVLDNETKRQLDNRQIERFNNYFPKDSWPRGAFKIVYRINQTYIEIRKNSTSPLHFEYSDDLKKIIARTRSVLKDERRKIKLEVRSSIFRINRSTRLRYYENLNGEISPIATYDQFFVPAGRSFFANIQSSIFSFLSDNRSIDPFLIEFGSFYENFKHYSRETAAPKKYEELISEILNGNYFREKEKDFLVHRDSRKVNLSNASSGQQETLPLVIVLQAISSLNFSDRGSTLYIEEPEAHLFPTAQKRIVQLLARSYNTIDKNFQIIVTTHSPYILSSFNNLIEAGKIINDDPNKSVSVHKIVPKDEVLNPFDLVAYSIDKGEKTVLLDKNSKLISQNILDSVSDEISLEFGKLLDIEF